MSAGRRRASPAFRPLRQKDLSFLLLRLQASTVSPGAQQIADGVVSKGVAVKDPVTLWAPRVSCSLGAVVQLGDEYRRLMRLCRWGTAARNALAPGSASERRTVRAQSGALASCASQADESALCANCFCLAWNAYSTVTASGAGKAALQSRSASPTAGDAEPTAVSNAGSCWAQASAHPPRDAK